MNRRFSPAICLMSLLVALCFSSVASAQDVPFKGKATGQDQSVTPEADGIRIISKCVGEATFLGRFIENIDYLFSYDLVHFAGVGTFTAANGDEVYFTFEGTIPGYVNGVFPLPFTATFVIAGGTGKFADVTGKGNLNGIDYGGGSFAFTFDGVIDY
jgi:hypothetical protein